MDEKTFYGTLTVFMYVIQPTANPDRPAQRGRRTLYKACGITQEEAQHQALAFTNHNKEQIRPNWIWATWQPDPIELETR